MTKQVINSKGIYYRQLNEQIRKAVSDGVTEFELENVEGQRYIAAALHGDIRFLVHGTPGQDMAAFMRGPYIRVEGNVQDGMGNTMDEGKVVVTGLAGDVAGYAMRGGSLYIKGDVGYRVGIHMKAFKDRLPVIVIGGKAGDFLGEYMAGGIIVLLGMYSQRPNMPIAGHSLGTGMHGGVIYVRGGVPEQQLGPNLGFEETDEADMEQISRIVKDYARELGLDAKEILAEKFVRIRPKTHRPYGNMYIGI